MGLFLLVLAGHGLFTRVTYWKGTKVHRADAPFDYWFSIAFAFLWGVAATAAGIALL
jgi:hypothetical protein